MVRAQLRIYCGPEVTDEASADAGDAFGKPSVPMSLGELCRVLQDATHHRRAWLDDFQDDDILISPDLYEVLLAYQHYHHRPSA